MKKVMENFCHVALNGLRLLLLVILISLSLGGYAESDMFFVHTDHLGTPQVLTDKDQNIVWRANYTPFGEADIVVDQVEMPLRFPGQYFDKETGYYYNYYRTYDQSTGRYLQSDPIGLRGGLNTYAYVGGNPVRFVDPLGLRASYCQRPLGDYSGENGGGPPVLNHQFICVTLEDGSVRCDSQNNPDNDPNGPLWPSPGQPSFPDRDNEQNSQCEDIDDDEDRCFEQCVIDQWAQPRPPYAIGPLGTDCQEYSQDIATTCRQQCSQ